MASGIDGDAFPERVQDHDVAEIHVDAGAAEFKNFAADRFVDGKIEKLIAVVTEIAASDLAGLQAVGADELSGFEVGDHEVVAEIVEGIDVECVAVGGGQAFAKFQVENIVTQALAG